MPHDNVLILLYYYYESLTISPVAAQCNDAYYGKRSSMLAPEIMVTAFKIDSQP